MLSEISRETLFDCIPERELNLADKSFKAFIGALGNFTVVVIQAKSGQLYAGVSKRNPCDKENSAGVCIAATRAWRSYNGKDEGYSRQRPVSKNQARRIAAQDRALDILDRCGFDLDDVLARG